MATITIPDLKTVHKPYREAIGRRTKLQQEEIDLRRRYDKETHEGTTPNNDPGLVKRANAVSMLLPGAEADANAEKHEARSIALALLTADPAFRKLFAATAQAMAERLAPLAAYESVRAQAGSAGVFTVPLPPVAAEELREFTAWLRDYRVAPLIDVAALPASVRGLLGEGSS